MEALARSVFRSPTLHAPSALTYFAQALSNFELQLNTKVHRAVRTGFMLTGVETEDSKGNHVIVDVNDGGKVILAAGALSTSRILFRSGIGHAT
jgi:cellobiose dehydrogenase (acceptor)